MIYGMKIRILFSLLLIPALSSCAVSTKGQQTGKAESIVIPGGTVSPVFNVGFDAYYDQSLDDVVPGYKLLTVAYTNGTLELIQLDPLGDRWYVIDKKGNRHEATINLRQKDPDTWSGLPKKLKVMIEYPLIVPAGGTVTIDLMFKKKIDLTAFKEVIYRPAGARREYRIIPREHL
jgi:hypothetical protein